MYLYVALAILFSSHFQSLQEGTHNNVKVLYLKATGTGVTGVPFVMIDPSCLCLAVQILFQFTITTLHHHHFETSNSCVLLHIILILSLSAGLTLTY